MTERRFEDLSEVPPLINLGELVIVILVLLAICLGVVGAVWLHDTRTMIADNKIMISDLLLRLDQVDSTMKRLISEIEKISSFKVDQTSIMVASWYGAPYHLRTAASGEIFNKFDLTAAHRTLPFGTRIRLTSPIAQIIVRINDRGPFIDGRDLDVSESAAEKLGFKEAGISRLKAEVLKIHSGGE